MTIDPSSGMLTWVVPSSQQAGDYVVTIRVTESGVTPLSVTSSFTIEVAPPGEFTEVSGVSGSQTFGGAATLTAELDAAGTPLAGRLITFSETRGGTTAVIGSATTGADGVATLHGVSLANYNAGAYTGVIVASFSGDAADSPDVQSGGLTVTPAQATLTLSGLIDTYDGTAHFAGVDSNLPGIAGVTVTYSQNHATVASPTHAGSYDVTASITNPNYSALVVTGTLVIAQATPIISWDRPASIRYGTPLGAGQLDARVIAIGPDLPAPLTYDRPAGTVLHTGQGQALTASLAATQDYKAATFTVQIDVLPAPLTIRADDRSKIAGEPNPPLSASISGFVNGDTAVLLATGPTLSTTATEASRAGLYPIVAAGAASADYTIAYIAGVMKIIPAPVVVQGVTVQTIHFNKRKTSTAIVVQFSDDLDTGAAQAIANYILATVPKGKKGHPKKIALASAKYDSVRHTVSLTTAKKLLLKPPPQLRIIATSLPDALGRPLDGDHDGKAGGDFQVVL